MHNNDVTYHYNSGLLFHYCWLNTQWVLNLPEQKQLSKLKQIEIDRQTSRMLWVLFSTTGCYGRNKCDQLLHRSWHCNPLLQLLLLLRRTKYKWEITLSRIKILKNNRGITYFPQRKFLLKNEMLLRGIRQRIKPFCRCFFFMTGR